jgi:nanoRNase/pAp phosphatase (c-di-AMP/oligoRNAs hydrolase)
MKELAPLYSEEFERLRTILADKKELLVIIHTNPDPDALGSAIALAFIAEKMSGIKASIAYSGDIGRIENKLMVSALHIKAKQIAKIKFSKYDLIALVDTQPGAGNNELPGKKKCNIVIDHHPRKRKKATDISVINPLLGATATVLVHWLKMGDFPIPSDLATALAYAISSETQNMYRETTEADIDAYSFIYPKSNVRKLAQITNPHLPHAYFALLSRALRNAVMYRHVIVCHLGEVTAPEFVAEMADILVRHRNISWSFCTGYKKNILHMSLRSKSRNARAGRIIRKLVKEVDNAGGHDLSAGGFIKLENTKKEYLDALFQTISLLLAKALGYQADTLKWKPLVEEADTVNERTANPMQVPAP